MSALSRIEIRNFQSHRHTVIEPAPAGGLTVIVGPSDSGKTAILRSLKWLLYNLPEGSDFRRVGCDLVEVSIKTTDSHDVTRSRTASTNRYVVDGAKLEGFGRSVPAEVQQITGVFPVRLGDQEVPVNFAGQLEAPFLGSSLSGPARAKVLGKLAGTEVIDRASRDLGTDLYRVRQGVKQLEAEEADLETRIAGYSHLPALAERIARLRTLQGRIAAAEERLATLRPRAEALKSLLVRIEATRTGLAALGDPERALARMAEAERDLVRLYRLTGHRRNLRSIDEQRAEAQKNAVRYAGAQGAGELIVTAEISAGRVQRLASARQRLAGIARSEERARREAEGAERTLAALDAAKPAEAALERIGRLRAAASRFQALTQERQKALGQIELHGRTLEEAWAEYTRVMIEAGSCPYCGERIDPDHNHLSEVLTA